MDTRRALRRAAARRESVCISRRGARLHSVRGFPLAIGRSLVLLYEEYDFNLDGYVVLPLRDIAEVRSGEHERFTERVFRDEGRLDSVHSPQISFHLDDWRNVLSALAAAGEIVIVECETLPDDEFYIGVVTGMSSDAVGIHDFDATAVWYPEPTVVRYEDITRVRFNERYTQVFDRYVGDPPS